MSSIVQISRSRYVERDRATAVLRLDQHYFYVGEPVMVRYYTDPEVQVNTDTLLAVGIAEGEGKDCYKIVSLGGLELIRDIIYDLPDVSELVHGETYLYQDIATKDWYYIYEMSGERQIERVTAQETIFVNIQDRYKWYWKDGVLRREDDFYSSTEIDSVLDEFVNLVSPPKVEVESTTGYIFEQGSEQDITLKINVIDASGSNITENCIIEVDGSKINLKKGNVWTAKRQTVSHDYVVVAKFDVNRKEFKVQSVCKIRFGYPFYYGAVPSMWVPTAATIAALTPTDVQPRVNYKWENITLENQRSVFAYPKSYGLLTHIFDDNGLCYIPDYTVHTVTLASGDEYYVYVKNEPIQITGFIQEFVFAVEDTTDEIRFDGYSKMVSAWRGQGFAGGLVVLGADGKIPESLIPSSEFTGNYIGLKNILPYYPTHGITPGDVWYNSETKKIFIGVGADSGKIEDPREDKIYLNMTDNTLYVWDGSKMVNIGGSVMSDKITNISEIL